MESKINGGKADPVAVYRRDGSARTAGTIAVASGGYSITDTATTAQVGDIYKAVTATTSVMVGKEYKVIEASTNSFTIASKDLPTSGDTFYILAPTTPRYDSTGGLSVSSTSPVNSNGSIVNTSLSGTTASSASAPSNAIGFILQAPSTNTHNIRWCIGGTASTTVGMLYEPGRDTGFVPGAATISICAITSGTNAFSIQWILSS